MELTEKGDPKAEGEIFGRHHLIRRDSIADDPLDPFYTTDKFYTAQDGDLTDGGQRRLDLDKFFQTHEKSETGDSGSSGTSDIIDYSGDRGTEYRTGVTFEPAAYKVGPEAKREHSLKAEDQDEEIQEEEGPKVAKKRINMTSLARVRPFTGKRDAKENAEDFLDDVEFAAEQFSTGPPEDKMFIRLFRQHVEDKALDFWLELDAEKKALWKDVKEMFLGKFGGARKLDQAERMSVTSRVMALSQDKKSISEYVMEAKQLCREVPTELTEMFAICFVKGLTDQAKKSAVSFALRNGRVDFKRALEVVKASYMVIGDPDVFDSEAPVGEKLTVAAAANTEVLSELLKYLKSNANRAQTASANQPRTNTGPALVPSAMTNPTQQQNIPVQYQRQANPYVTCYNCGKNGHYMPDCGEAQQPWEVRQSHRDRAQKEAAEYRERKGQKAIMAASAIAEVTGDVVRANMAIVKVKSEEIKELVKKDKLLHICALLSKIPKARALVAAAGEKRGRDENDVENVLPADKHSKLDDGIVRMDAVVDAQAKVPEPVIIFDGVGEDSGDEVLGLTRDKGKKGNVSAQGRPQEKKKIVKAGLAPIKAMDGLSSFDLTKYMQNMVVNIGLPQLLQESPALRRQLVMLLTSANPRKKRTVRASAALAEAGVTTAPELDEDSLEAMFIDVSVCGARVSSVLVDGGSLIDLISAKLVAALKLPVFTGEGWSILLANDATVKVNKYVWVDVTVAKVTAKMKLYVLDIEQSYTILLSRRWLRRVKAVEDYFEHRLIIEGNDGVRRIVVGTAAEGKVVDVFQDASEELEEEGAEEESDDVEEMDKAITELLDELEEWEYENDVEGDDAESGNEVRQ